jgi:serine/threonine-protein kinase
MAVGLADIHGVDVIHRDIKPNNMLVDPEGILKIIDFNLARTDEGAHTHGFVGTPGYAAPELFRAGRVDFGKSIDVYALAVTAYALLKGPSLPGPLNETPPRTGEWIAAGGGFVGARPGLDAEIVRLLDASLNEDPLARPSARQIADRAARVLLVGKHKALFATDAGAVFELSATKPRVRLQHPKGLASLSIGYDGLDFRAVDLSGEVWINNMQLAVGAILPSCCVIGLGSPTRPHGERLFVTMDVSYPEVVL